MERDLAGATLLTLGGRVAAGSGVLPPGTVVAGYRIEARAGVGGMGVVYRATDLDLDRAVALKVIAPEFAADERFRELFIAESRRAAALEHPNIIPIYRSGDEDGLLYIAMRYVEGASLQEMITRRGRLTVGAAVRIVEQIADALDHAHAHGLVHRDVKPGNVLIATRSGAPHVYLTDFGLAVPIADTASGSHGRYAGTPAYLSPEQIRDEPVDGRTDVYSLGCVLFHALTGRVPFTGPGFEAKVVSHLTERPPAVTTVVEGLPARLDDVLRRAMAKRPEDRFRSAGDLADAARDARADVVVCHHPDDAGVARSICDRLVTRGVEARTVVADAEVDLWSAHGCLLVVGEHDLAKWASDLLAKTSDITAHDPGYTVTSVLAPGAPDPFAPSLAPLAGRPFVDLRGGLDDPDAAADLLRTVGRPDRDPPHASSDTPPYRGLEAFQEDDAALFFGRDHEVAALTEKLRTGRFLAVLGASGSGKSSLVRAGLLPTLRGDRATVVALLTPGGRPLSALAAALESTLGASAPTVDELLDDTRALDRAARSLRQRDEPGRLVVVVDQFEETFSLGPNADEQRAFIDNLVFAATIPGGPTTVVLAMRSDFYHRSADHVALRALIAERQFLVGPLGPDGLRQAIEEPARACGLELERGLVRRILSDVSEEPGALPLMEHLLLELWERRRGRLLTLEGYAAAGGVSGALAQHADDAYESLPPEQRETARHVLLRLTQPGEGTEDTRRRALVSELATSEDDASSVREVVDALVVARLLVLSTEGAADEPSVEVTHEALIRGWPRLRAWIEADRENLRLHRRLTDAAQEWAAGGRDDSALYRGTRLALWDGRDTGALNTLERSFLDESSKTAAKDAAATRRRTKLALGALTGGVVVIGGLAAFAFLQRDAAQSERDEATSRAIAGIAREELAIDPARSVLLALEADKLAPTAQSEEALRQATFEVRARLELPGHAEQVGVVRFGPGSTLIATGDHAGVVRVWDAKSGDELRRLGSSGVIVSDLAFAQDGVLYAAFIDGTLRRWEPAELGDGTVLAKIEGEIRAIGQIGPTTIAVGDSTGAVWMLDTRTKKRTLRYRHETPITRLATDAGGRRIATGDEAGLVRVWTAARPDAPTFDPGTGESIRALALSPNGQRILVGDLGGTTRVLTRSGDRVAALTGFEGFLTDASFSPDGQWIVTTGNDSAGRVWSAEDGTERSRLLGHDGPVVAATFDGTGNTIATGGPGEAYLWDWRAGTPRSLVLPGEQYPSAIAIDSTGTPVAALDSGTLVRWTPERGVATRLPIGSPVGAAAITRDAGTIAVATPDGSILHGPITPAGVGPMTSLTGTPGPPVIQLAISADGARALTRDGSGGVHWRDLISGSADHTLPLGEGPPLPVAFGSNNDQALVAVNGTVQVWDLAKNRHVRTISAHSSFILGMAPSPDGGLVATVSADRTARVIDPNSGDQLAAIRGFRAPLSTVAFSPDGRLLLVGGDDAASVWDWKRRVAMVRLPGSTATVAGAIDNDGWIAIGGVVEQGSDQYALRAWPCATCGGLPEVRREAAEYVPRGLTDDERQTFLAASRGVSSDAP